MNEKLNILGMDYNDMKVANPIPYKDLPGNVMMSDSLKGLLPDNLMNDDLVKLQENTWHAVVEVVFRNDERLNIVGMLTDLSENDFKRSISLKTDAMDAMMLQVRFMNQGNIIAFDKIVSLQLSNGNVDEPVSFDVKTWSLKGCRVHDIDYKSNLACLSLSFTRDGE